MSIHIVTHCYAVRLPQYAKQLCCQLSSLVENDDVPVRITVCLSFVDNKTIDVINWFRDNYPKLNLHTLMMDDAHLFRRSIGRNIATVGAKEGLTWFTDVDHEFGPNCLASLWSTWQKAQMNYDNITLLYPNQILIHRDHATGDAEMEKVEIPSFHLLDYTTFVPKQYNRAIGGIQIVPRWYLTKYGYLRDSEKYQTQTDGKAPFPDFRDDVAFRSGCQQRGRVLPIQLPNLHRIRHSKTTYQGQSHEEVVEVD